MKNFGLGLLFGASVVAAFFQHELRQLPQAIESTLSDPGSVLRAGSAVISQLGILPDSKSQDEYASRKNVLTLPGGAISESLGSDPSVNADGKVEGEKSSDQDSAAKKEGEENGDTQSQTEKKEDDDEYPVDDSRNSAGFNRVQHISPVSPSEGINRDRMLMGIGAFPLGNQPKSESNASSSGITTQGYSQTGNSGSQSDSLSGLSEEDWAFLGVGLLGRFENTEKRVSGLACASSQARSPCEKDPNFPVHSLRWDLSHGLIDTTQVRIMKSSTHPAGIEVSFGVKIADSSGKISELSHTLVPSRVSFSSASGSRQIQFQFSNFKLSEQDQLHDVAMVVSWGADAQGQLELKSESKWTFSRQKVKTNAYRWEEGPNRVPAESEPFLIADQIPYVVTFSSK